MNPFPEKFHRRAFNRKLTDEEFAKVKAGHLRGDMDDRWIIYFQQPWLFFYRSWTENCIYKVHIVEKKDAYYIDEILTNGEQSQYKYVEENEPTFFEHILNLFFSFP